MDRRTFLLAALAALPAAALLSGCGKQTGASGPPEIKYGRQVCLQCGMIISDVRYAYLGSDGDPRCFDDIGCLVAYRQTRAEPTTAVWVHDFTSKEWLAAEAATYVRSRQIATPMGYGLAAVAGEAAAGALAAAKAGEVLTWRLLVRADPTASASGPGHPATHRPGS